MPTVKFRAYDKRLRPRRVKLEVPGWAGQNEKREDGAQEYPWHCVPFSEAARGGLELCFPWPEPLHVHLRGGALIFADADGTPVTPGPQTPPFRSFGPAYFTFRSSIDLKPEPGWAIKIEPHPRFFTDTTGTVPVAVPALLHGWWPMINFLVFKAPPEGGQVIFRPGEPFVMASLVPAEQSLEIAEMGAEEAAERELQSRRIYASRATLSADTTWTSATRTVFDGTYRRLAGAARSVAARARAGAAVTASADRGDGGGGDDGASPAAEGAAAAGNGAAGDAGGGDGGGGVPPGPPDRGGDAQPAGQRPGRCPYTSPSAPEAPGPAPRPE